MRSPKSLRMPTKARALLIRQDDKLGEALLITPALQAIKEAAPEWEFDVWLGERWTRVLKQNYNVNRVSGVPFRPRGKAFLSLLSAMRSRQYQAVILSRPQSAFYTFMARLAQIPTRIGSAKPNSLLARLLTHNVYTVHDAPIHQVERNLQLAERLTNRELPRLPLQFALGEAAESTMVDCPSIVLHLGVGGANRAWRPEQFLETAQLLADSLRDYAFILTGSVTDEERAKTVLQMFPKHTQNWIGKTTLEDMAHVLKAAELLISVDTGVVHLAAALQTPCVSLYPKREYPPERWHPWMSPYKAICPTRYCEDCTAMRCAQVKSDCVSTIQPERVARAAIDLLAECRSDQRLENLCE